MTEHIFPVKVIKTEGNVKNAASLLKKKDLLVGFFEKNQAIVSGEAAIMLDFGKEYCGSVKKLRQLLTLLENRGILTIESVCI